MVIRSRDIFEEDRIRCSACNFPCDPDSRPKGGEFTHQNLTDSYGHEYDGNGSQGCPLCGSPAWHRGAELGDMKGWFAKRH